MNAKTNAQQVETTEVSIVELPTQTQNTVDVSKLTYEQLFNMYHNAEREVQKQINALELWAEVQWKSPVDIFGEFWKGPGDNLPVRKHRHPDCRKAPESYMPDSELLLDGALFLTGERNLSMGIYGHTGTGKSEMARYLSDKLCIPMLQVSITESTREDKLNGTYLLKDGETIFDLGVVGRAYDSSSVGYMLVVEEVDKGNDAVIAKLHDVADYKPFTVEDTGDTYYPHDSFRLMLTGQTCGMGDPLGIYNVNKLDRAFVARCSWSRSKYPNRKIMKDIINHEFPRLEEATVEPLMTFYEFCTEALENVWREQEGIDEVQVGDGTVGQLTTPTSIRIIKGLADQMVKFGNFRTVEESFSRTILMSAEEDDKESLKLLLRVAFGEDVNQPPKVTPLKPVYLSSEMQDLSSVEFGAYVHQGENGVGRKMWFIGADERGSHTLYTHPETGELTYYHRPLVDFDEGLAGIKEYCQSKIAEKMDKGYRLSCVVRYNQDAEQDQQFTKLR